MNTSSKIYVAGHRGLVGSALMRRLQASGYYNLIVKSHAELDLELQSEVWDFFSRERPDYVFLAAAKVGGIHANNTYPADFILSNLKIQTNVLEACWRHKVKGCLFLGSSCIYPKLAPQPINEDCLLTGPLEPTNKPYAIAKIAGIELCESFNRQHGTRFMSVMPTNLYGPNDNYDLLDSHVLPALIRKFHLAKLASRGMWEMIKKDEENFGRIPDDFKALLNAIAQANHFSPELTTPHSIHPDSALTLWGTGSPRREFLYSDNLADACIFLMQRLEMLFTGSSLPGGGKQHLMNIGTGKELTIRELAELVSRTVKFEGGIKWDVTKPDGTPRKLLDTGRLIGLGWQPTVSLESGIELAYQDYLHKFSQGC